MAVRMLCTAVLALLALAGARAEEDNVAALPMYSDNIWDALVKLGSVTEYTRTALEITNLEKSMMNGSLKRTFFAMDNEAWLDLARHYNYHSVDALFMNTPLVEQILLNHQLQAPHTTAFWPPYPQAGIPVDTVLVQNGKPNVLHLRTDAAGDYEIVGFIYVGELSPRPGQVNLKAGGSVVHVIHDVDKVEGVY